VTYLLDANVLSETRKRQPAAGVADWIAATPPERMYVSVLTLRDREVEHWRDYLDPLAVFDALGWPAR